MERQPREVPGDHRCLRIITSFHCRSQSAERDHHPRRPPRVALTAQGGDNRPLPPLLPGRPPPPAPPRLGTPAWCRNADQLPPGGACPHSGRTNRSPVRNSGGVRVARHEWTDQAAVAMSAKGRRGTPTSGVLAHGHSPRPPGHRRPGLAHTAGTSRPGWSIMTSALSFVGRSWRLTRCGFVSVRRSLSPSGVMLTAHGHVDTAGRSAGAGPLSAQTTPARRAVCGAYSVCPSGENRGANSQTPRLPCRTDHPGPLPARCREAMAEARRREGHEGPRRSNWAEPVKCGVSPVAKVGMTLGTDIGAWYAARMDDSSTSLRCTPNELPEPEGGQDR